MSVTVFGDELLKAYRGDLGISATKTDVTVTKDGVSYQAGRTLPIGTYTIVATPQGSATLTSLEVNGESFVSGSTIDVAFGTNINVSAVSEGGEPQPVTDLTGTKWTYTIPDDVSDIFPVTDGRSDAYMTVEFEYSGVQYTLGSLTSSGIFMVAGSGSKTYYLIFPGGTSNYPRIQFSKTSPYFRFYRTSTSNYVDLPAGTVLTFTFSDNYSGVHDQHVIDFVNNNFTQVIE